MSGSLLGLCFLGAMGAAELSEGATEPVSAVSMGEVVGSAVGVGAGEVGRVDVLDGAAAVGVVAVGGLGE